MDLGDLRTQIDAVDEQIVDLYERGWISADRWLK